MCLKWFICLFLGAILTHGYEGIAQLKQSRGGIGNKCEDICHDVLRFCFPKEIQDKASYDKE